MSLVAEEVRAHLDSLGMLGTLFRGSLPSKPDVCGAVYATGGPPPDVALCVVTTALLANPTVQLSFRGDKNDYDSPNAIATLAWNAMIAINSGTLLSGTKYYMVRPLQQPFSIGKDELERFRIVCNYLIRKDPS